MGPGDRAWPDCMSVDFEVLSGLLFLGTAVSLLLLEAVPSLRARRIVRTRRWTSNVALLVLGTGIWAYKAFLK